MLEDVKKRLNIEAGDITKNAELTGKIKSMMDYFETRIGTLIFKRDDNLIEARRTTNGGYYEDYLRTAGTPIRTIINLREIIRDRIDGREYKVVEEFITDQNLGKIIVPAGFYEVEYQSGYNVLEDDETGKYNLPDDIREFIIKNVIRLEKRGDSNPQQVSVLGSTVRYGNLTDEEDEAIINKYTRTTF